MGTKKSIPTGYSPLLMRVSVSFIVKVTRGGRRVSLTDENVFYTKSD